MPAFKRTQAAKDGVVHVPSSSSGGKKGAKGAKGAKDSGKGKDGAGGEKSVHYKNKTRVLVLGSRGITARFRHLLEDMKKLLPHHKKDNKLDTKSDIKVVNEIAEMKSCDRVLYLECRKRRDLYMFMGATPNGPSVKFQVTNIHTMDELKLTGNCMLGSRPLLNFDARFDASPHWQIMKQVFTSTFGTPRGHPKSKPFVDRIMSFFVVNNNIWVRNFQILHKTDNLASSSSKVRCRVMYFRPSTRRPTWPPGHGTSPPHTATDTACPHPLPPRHRTRRAHILWRSARASCSCLFVFSAAPWAVPRCTRTRHT